MCSAVLFVCDVYPSYIIHVHNSFKPQQTKLTGPKRRPNIEKKTKTQNDQPNIENKKKGRSVDQNKTSKQNFNQNQNNGST